MKEGPRWQAWHSVKQQVCVQAPRSGWQEALGHNKNNKRSCPLFKKKTWMLLWQHCDEICPINKAPVLEVGKVSLKGTGTPGLRHQERDRSSNGKLGEANLSRQEQKPSLNLSLLGLDLNLTLPGVKRWTGPNEGGLGARQEDLFQEAPNLKASQLFHVRPNMEAGITHFQFVIIKALGRPHPAST